MHVKSLILLLRICSTPSQDVHRTGLRLRRQHSLHVPHFLGHFTLKKIPHVAVPTVYWRYVNNRIPPCSRVWPIVMSHQVKSSAALPSASVKDFGEDTVQWCDNSPKSGSASKRRSAFSNLRSSMITLCRTITSTLTVSSHGANYSWRVTGTLPSVHQSMRSHPVRSS